MGKKSKLSSIVILLFFFAELNAQTLWQKYWGGANLDFGNSIRMTSDGGFIIAGGTSSFGVGQGDIYVIKIDSLGNTIWTHTYGGPGEETASSVRQTSDGGYIISGGTTSFGALGTDVYLVRINSLGDTLWTKILQGYFDEYAGCLQITHDKGFIIAKSYINAFSLVKTDSLGNVQWDTVYAYPYYNGRGNWVEQTIDGGFILTGNAGVSPSEIRLVKTDPFGKIQWQKIYFTPTEDDAASVLQTADGNYFIVGTVGPTENGSDMLLIKTDPLGNEIWTKTYGGRYNDEGYFIIPMDDGNYILGGSTDSYGANRNEAWLVKINPEGTILGSATAGGIYEESAVSGVKTPDGRIVIAGYTASFGAGSDDVYAAKINIIESEYPLLMKLNEYFHFYDKIPLQPDIYSYPTRSQKTLTNDPSLLDPDDFWVLLMYPEKLSFMSNNSVNGEIDMNDWYMMDPNNIDELSFDISHFGGYLPNDIKEMLINFMNIEFVNGPWYINADTIRQTNGNIDTVTATYPVYKNGELAGEGKMTVWYDDQRHDLQGVFHDYVLDFTDTISGFNPVISVDTLKVKIPLLPDSVQAVYEKVITAYNLRSMARMKAPPAQGPFPTILDVTPQAFLLSYLVEAKIYSIFTLHAPFMDFEIDTSGNLNCLLEAVLSIYDFFPGETIVSPVFPDQLYYSGIEIFPPTINIWLHNYLETPFTQNKLHYQRVLGSGAIHSTLPSGARQSQYLSVLGEGPVDLELTDPEGLVIKKSVNNISNTKYVEADVNNDLETDDFILLPYAKPDGSYSIKVIAEQGASSTDTYSLRVAFRDTIIVLAQDVLISNIPSTPYIFGPVYLGAGDETKDNLPPDGFTLYQNYPNPFNPDTRIKYSLPGNSVVTIKIFDVLGREIKTLVNEEKPSGTYETFWNAVNLPSGVYFYQLKATSDGGQAGDFVQTKKMILVK